MYKIYKQESRGNLIMKKVQIKSFMTGFILCAMISIGAMIVSANSQAVTKQVTYGVGVNLNGEALVFDKDSQPFVMDGKTFLPVNTIADALNLTVDFNATSNTVILNSRKVVGRLDEIAHTDFKTGGAGGLHKIVGTMTDHLGEIHDNGIILRGNGIIKDDPYKASALVEYPLNGQYKKLSGTLVIPKEINVVELSKRDVRALDSKAIIFYGDGKLLHKVNHVTPTTPIDFSFDVSGVNSLTIRMESNSLNIIALVDLDLFR